MRLLVVAVIILAGGCAETTASDPAQDDTVSRPSQSLTPSTPSGPSPSRTMTPAVSNLDALRGGIAMLRNAGVRDIGEAEPPHGDTDAELMGRWGGHVVVVHVAPDGSPEVQGEVVAVDEIAGVQVETVKISSRTAPVLRYAYGPFEIDFQVLTNDFDFLRRESLRLLSVILCPSRVR